GYGIGPAKVHNFQEITAKFVRLMVKTSSHPAGPHIAEFEIYTNDVIPQWPEEDVMSAVDIKQTSLKLQWLPANDEQGIVEYKIYKDLQEFVTLSPDQHEYEVTKLESDTP